VKTTKKNSTTNFQAVTYQLI